MLIEWAAQSDTGRQRDHNEDSFLADETEGLWVVADGMGGHVAGEVASSLALEANTNVWSVDNRTAGFRLCGADTKAVRVECRIGGSDLNPYLAIAAQLAAGIKGLEDTLELPKPTTGDVYETKSARRIPHSLRDATVSLRKSTMLRQAFGDGVIDHYVRAAEWEQEEFDRIVTDYEVARGFERA